MSINTYGFKWHDCFVLRACERDGYLSLEIVRNGHHHSVVISPKGKKVTMQYHGPKGNEFLKSIDVEGNAADTL
jgi:hypothetical protein